MQRPFADRVHAIKQSDIRRYSAICAAMNGVNLSQGVCDQPAHPVVKEAAKKAIDANHASYTNLRGIAELRQAIALKMKNFNKVTVDPQSEIAVTVGAAGGFSCTILSTLNPGDECIVFSPYYSYHVNLLRLFGMTVKYVDLNPPNWSYDPQQLAKAFGPRTRMIEITTPANPSGKIFTEAELKEIGNLAAKHDCWIVTDEIYEYITYGKKHVSLASFPEFKDRTVTLSGASKTFAVTGWRVGYCVGPASLIERISVVNDLLYICAPAPLQYGIAAGLALPDSYYDEMRAEYTVKREMLADALRAIDFIPFVPDGSYYMLAAFEQGRWANATEATEDLLKQVGVATVPGAAFYRNPADGDNQLRFCFAKEMPVLEEACKRIRKVSSTRTAALTARA